MNRETEATAKRLAPIRRRTPPRLRRACVKMAPVPAVKAEIAPDNRPNRNPVFKGAARCLAYTAHFRIAGGEG